MKKNEKEVVKKKKFKLTKFLIVLLILYIIGLYTYKLFTSPINNIFIENNNYLTDQEVIDIAGINDYPSFILTTKYKMKKNLLKNNFIKDVTIKKELGRVVTINIKENEALFIYNNKVVLSNGKSVNYSNYKLPTLIGSLEEDILNKLIDKYQLINEEIRIMISEIKYDPNNIDKERFLITMNDGNYVYITLYKTTSINDYIKILSKFDDTSKKGILYLDSGNYFETFKD